MITDELRPLKEKPRLTEIVWGGVSGTASWVVGKGFWDSPPRTDREGIRDLKHGSELHRSKEENTFPG